ncbi:MULTISPECIES: carbohydrate ABC transporter permease [unclassified Bartonella]|uniref:carbohydrate ABC transporter permease n=1 Tax=unclassified Bartonella TaxID=2645622 RepID=UPI0015F81C78|nr:MULTISPECIES: carbohydrate ABC transporter permease [unclassified Bartonella]UXN02898.1 carbohydrate ABC transporter permease [Bartonella sp. HY406]UXN05861.1 carbohydrate ABC transporter permease [Bartonella sp. HY761]
MSRTTEFLETIGAWFLALLWILPVIYAFWTAFHPSEYATRFDLTAPLTLDNFKHAWAQAPFLRYYFNTTCLVLLILCGQIIVATLAAYAFARFNFIGRDILFILVLIQLMIMPDVLIVENYRIVSGLGLLDTIPAMALPYIASAFGIFLLRQTFKNVPNDLVDAAKVEGTSSIGILLKVFVPLAKPTYIAFALVSASFHWNNFLWPLIVTNSVESRPLTVGLAIFGSPETGVNWSTITAATVMTIAPLLIAFLLFQRQFVQSFMHAGIK